MQYLLGCIEKKILGCIVNFLQTIFFKNLEIN